jgi:S1-C subfamily serine protease
MKLAPRILLIACISGSCASIVTGPSDEVMIRSTPLGAQFITNNGQNGRTPSQITVSDELTLQVQMQLEGYEPATASLPPRMSGWFLGNLLFGGLVGMAIDYVSGNYMTHDNELMVVLVPTHQLTPREPPRVEDTTATGTGFAVTTDGMILTAGHVVEGADEIRVRLSDGTWHSAVIFAISQAYDLAILKVEVDDLVALHLASSAEVSIGQRLFTMGYPAINVLGSEPKYSDGALSSKSGVLGNTSFLQVTIPIQPGNSGGPIVTEDGLVVGIVTSTAAVGHFFDATGSLPQNINWGIKAEFARLMYEDNQGNPPKLDRRQAIQRTTAAICLIEARVQT